MPVIKEMMWAPALMTPGKRKPTIFYKYMRPSRRVMIEDFVAASFRGEGDWQYRYRLGFRAVRVRVTGFFRR